MFDRNAAGRGSRHDTGALRVETLLHHAVDADQRHRLDPATTVEALGGMPIGFHRIAERADAADADAGAGFAHDARACLPDAVDPPTVAAPGCFADDPDASRAGGL